MAIRSGISALACAALLGSAAAASPQAGVVGGAGDKVVCKTFQKTGTRFEEKSCRTRTQWEQLRIQQRRDARDFIDRPTIETRRGG